MRKFTSFFVILLLGSLAAAAQTITVKGKITDSRDGSPLPGVSVQVKGTAQGAVSGGDGTFTLNAPREATLVFSFVGYQPQELKLSGRTVLNVSLSVDPKSIKELVVTAFGIKREKKAVSYALTDVKGEQLQQISEPDPLRALSGKVPGVNITAGGGSPGQSTKILIRGNSSFTGNNQPLFVVDGVPFDNSVNPSEGYATATTYSNRGFDLDPNNIESMTVLKGASATALYGSRAANGAIIITTKSGAKNNKKGLEVTYSSSYSVEEIASVPDYQNVYGQGSNQNYNGGFIGNWGAPFSPYVDMLNKKYGTNYSKLDSVPHPVVNLPYTRPRYASVFPELVGKKVPYRPYDIVRGFFKPGYLLENSIHLNGGSDKTNISAGASRMTNEGIVPNSRATRTSLNFGGNATLTNGLVLSGNLNYVNTYQQNPQSGASFFEDYGGGTDGSIFARIFYLPRNYNLNGYPFENPVDGSNVFYRRLDNPRWTAKYNIYSSVVNRVFGNLNLSYDVKKWLNLAVRGGINTYTENRRSIIRSGGTAVPLGRVWTDDLTNTELNFTYLATVTTPITSKIDFRGILGLDMNERSFNRRKVTGTGIISDGLDGLYTTAATAKQIVDADYRQKQHLYGVFADLQFSYNNYLFLNLTGRNDFSSTLPAANRSYFYPSAGAGFVFSEALKIPENILSYGKIRGSYAKVGKDASPYQIQTVYSIGTSYTKDGDAIYGAGQTFNNATLSNTLKNANLRPEFTTEVEGGLELQFFKSRVGLDLTYFNRNSTDLIVPVTIPASSGFTSAVVNSGKINNKGWEIGLNLVPLKLNNGFTWTTYFAFSRLRSKVENAGPSGEFFIGGANSALGTIMRNGYPYGMIYGSKNARDDKGNLLIDETQGLPFPLPTSQIIGDPNPNFTLGFTNTFSFKGFTLSALFDYRDGGKMYSVTAASLLLRGQLAFSAEGREGSRVIPGVYGDPTTFKPILDDKGKTIKNTTPVTAFDSFFSNGFGAYGADETNVYDVTTIRLRELSLGYNIPKKVLRKTPFGSLRLSATARNIWFKAPNMLTGLNFDPEVLSNFADSNIQGFDFGAAPSTRRYGFNLTVTF